MDPEDFQDTLVTIVTAIRVTLRTELSSIWLPIQFGVIALAAIAAVGLSALVRRKFDLTAVTMGWPAYLRLAARALGRTRCCRWRAGPNASAAPSWPRP